MGQAESTRARLGRLRREPSEATPVVAADDAEPSAASHVARVLGKRTGRAPVPDAPPGTCPTTVGPPEELTTSDSEHGPVLYRETLHRADELHGNWRMNEVFEVQPRNFELLTGDGALRSLDPERAVYLDTETTGLGGGAGTWVYMVGLGTFEDGCFRVWQGFMEDPGGEHALLAEVARRVAGAESVVSFFGKSFDRHRLEDKMRVVGVESPFEGRPHLDLYHPLRRLTRGSFVDARLATMESELCGLARADDLPGALAPAAWFDFLAGRPHRLEGVFRHNLDDVRSLVTLAAYLGRVECEQRAEGAPLAGPELERASALGRSFLKAGDRVAARPWLARALERARDRGERVREHELAQAENLRLLGDRPAAAAALEALTEGPEDHVTTLALIARAKLLEHGERDRAGALALVERACELAPRHHVGRDLARLEADLSHRLARLT